MCPGLISSYTEKRGSRRQPRFPRTQDVGPDFSVAAFGSLGFVEGGDDGRGLADATSERGFEVDDFGAFHFRCRRRFGRGLGFGYGLEIGGDTGDLNCLSPAAAAPSITESEILEVKRRMARRASSLPGIT